MMRIMLGKAAAALLVPALARALSPGDGAYAGPVAPRGFDSTVRASFALAGGLILEVGPSTVPGAGLGLFARLEQGAEPLTVEAGTAVCGYARGAFHKTPDAGGKCVAYALADQRDAVWFDKELCQVGDLLRRPDVESVAGHRLPDAEEEAEYAERFLQGGGETEFDLAGTEQPVVLDDDTWDQGRYYRPDLLDLDGLDVLDLGQLANDLSKTPPPPTPNLLALVMRLERDPLCPARLVPTRPVSTLSQDVTFANEEPMEIGCAYGPAYWDALDAEMAWPAQGER